MPTRYSTDRESEQDVIDPQNPRESMSSGLENDICFLVLPHTMDRGLMERQNGPLLIQRVPHKSGYTAQENKARPRRFLILNQLSKRHDRYIFAAQAETKHIRVMAYPWRSSPNPNPTPQTRCLCMITRTKTSFCREIHPFSSSFARLHACASAWWWTLGVMAYPWRSSPNPNPTPQTRCLCMITRTKTSFCREIHPFSSSFARLHACASAWWWTLGVMAYPWRSSPNPNPTPQTRCLCMITRTKTSFCREIHPFSSSFARLHACASAWWWTLGVMAYPWRSSPNPNPTPQTRCLCMITRTKTSFCREIHPFSSSFARLHACASAWWWTLGVMAYPWRSSPNPNPTPQTRCLCMITRTKTSFCREIHPFSSSFARLHACASAWWWTLGVMAYPWRSSPNPNPTPQTRCLCMITRTKTSFCREIHPFSSSFARLHACASAWWWTLGVMAYPWRSSPNPNPTPQTRCLCMITRTKTSFCREIHPFSSSFARLHACASAWWWTLGVMAYPWRSSPNPNPTPQTRCLCMITRTKTSFCREIHPFSSSFARLHACASAWWWTLGVMAYPWRSSPNPNPTPQTRCLCMITRTKTSFCREIHPFSSSFARLHACASAWWWTLGVMAYPWRSSPNPNPTPQTRCLCMITRTKTSFCREIHPFSSSFARLHACASAWWWTLGVMAYPWRSSPNPNPTPQTRCLCMITRTKTSFCREIHPFSSSFARLHACASAWWWTLGVMAYPWRSSPNPNPTPQTRCLCMITRTKTSFCREIHPFSSSFARLHACASAWWWTLGVMAYPWRSSPNPNPTPQTRCLCMITRTKTSFCREIHPFSSSFARLHACASAWWWTLGVMAYPWRSSPNPNPTPQTRCLCMITRTKTSFCREIHPFSSSFARLHACASAWWWTLGVMAYPWRSSPNPNPTPQTRCLCMITRTKTSFCREIHPFSSSFARLHACASAWWWTLGVMAYPWRSSPNPNPTPQTRCLCMITRTKTSFCREIHPFSSSFARLHACASAWWWTLGVMAYPWRSSPNPNPTPQTRCLCMITRTKTSFCREIHPFSSSFARLHACASAWWWTLGVMAYPWRSSPNPNPTPQTRCLCMITRTKTSFCREIHPFSSSFARLHACASAWWWTLGVMAYPWRSSPNPNPTPQTRCLCMITRTKTSFCREIHPFSSSFARLHACASAWWWTLGVMAYPWRSSPNPNPTPQTRCLCMITRTKTSFCREIHPFSSSFARLHACASAWWWTLGVMAYPWRSSPNPNPTPQTRCLCMITRTKTSFCREIHPFSSSFARLHACASAWWWTLGVMAYPWRSSPNPNPTPQTRCLCMITRTKTSFCREIHPFSSSFARLHACASAWWWTLGVMAYPWRSSPNPNPTPQTRCLCMITRTKTSFCREIHPFSSSFARLHACASAWWWTLGVMAYPWRSSPNPNPTPQTRCLCMITRTKTSFCREIHPFSSSFARLHACASAWWWTLGVMAYPWRSSPNPNPTPQTRCLCMITRTKTSFCREIHPFSSSFARLHACASAWWWTLGVMAYPWRSSPNPNPTPQTRCLCMITRTKTSFCREIHPFSSSFARLHACASAWWWTLGVMAYPWRSSPNPNPTPQTRCLCMITRTKTSFCREIHPFSSSFARLHACASAWWWTLGVMAYPWRSSPNPNPTPQTRCLCMITRTKTSFCREIHPFSSSFARLHACASAWWWTLGVMAYPWRSSPNPNPTPQTRCLCMITRTKTSFCREIHPFSSSFARLHACASAWWWTLGVMAYPWRSSPNPNPTPQTRCLCMITRTKTSFCREIHPFSSSFARLHACASAWWWTLGVMAYPWRSSPNPNPTPQTRCLCMITRTKTSFCREIHPFSSSFARLHACASAWWWTLGVMAYPWRSSPNPNPTPQTRCLCMITRTKTSFCREIHPFSSSFARLHACASAWWWTLGVMAYPWRSSPNPNPTPQTRCLCMITRTKTSFCREIHPFSSSFARLHACASAWWWTLGVMAYPWRSSPNPNPTPQTRCLCMITRTKTSFCREIHPFSSSFARLHACASAWWWTLGVMAYPWRSSPNPNPTPQTRCLCMITRTKTSFCREIHPFSSSFARLHACASAWWWTLGVMAYPWRSSPNPNPTPQTRCLCMITRTKTSFCREIHPFSSSFARLHACASAWWWTLGVMAYPWRSSPNPNPTPQTRCLCMITRTKTSFCREIHPFSSSFARLHACASAWWWTLGVMAYPWRSSPNPNPTPQTRCLCMITRTKTSFCREIHPFSSSFARLHACASAWWWTLGVMAYPWRSSPNPNPTPQTRCLCMITRTKTSFCREIHPFSSSFARLHACASAWWWTLGVMAYPWRSSPNPNPTPQTRCLCMITRTKTSFCREIHPFSSSFARLHACASAWWWTLGVMAYPWRSSPNPNPTPQTRCLCMITRTKTSFCREIHPFSSSFARLHACASAWWWTLGVMAYPWRSSPNPNPTPQTRCLCMITRTKTSFCREIHPFSSSFARLHACASAWWWTLGVMAYPWRSSPNPNPTPQTRCLCMITRTKTSFCREIHPFSPSFARLHACASAWWWTLGVMAYPWRSSPNPNPTPQTRCLCMITRRKTSFCREIHPSSPSFARLDACASAWWWTLGVMAYPWRQIAPPTKNGHAPPPIESRKSSQSVNPYYVWTWCRRSPKSNIRRSLLFVFHKSKNFTSDYEIRMPPTVPVNHYSDPEGQRAGGVLKVTSADPWSASFMVETRTLFVFHKSKNFTSDYEIRMPPTVPVNHYSDPEGQRQERIAGKRDEMTGAHRRRTGRPNPKSNYELFNCNNLNIRYWSWNYRGCWHQTCPPMDPR
ncbi:Tar1p [Dorcoceras hygrometricum]|uniref:Tar1p n=1 Tax=Dorcoceras hygrometricum TaxID=472368 RepID=A0A2Z7AL36_9LAMI|nr:Tar1p [Dorcoceras hygrometricum]